MPNVEEVAKRCCLKKVFLKIWQNLQKNTCNRVSGIGVFLWTFATFLRTFGGCFCKWHFNAIITINLCLSPFPSLRVNKSQKSIKPWNFLWRKNMFYRPWFLRIKYCAVSNVKSTFGFHSSYYASILMVTVHFSLLSGSAFSLFYPKSS